MTVMSKSEAFEKHYTAAELAKCWNVSIPTIRRWFQDRTDVLQFGVEHRAKKRGYVSIRIPESVAERVYFAKRKEKFTLKPLLTGFSRGIDIRL